MWRIKVLKKDWKVFKKRLFIAYAKLTRKKCCGTCRHWGTAYNFIKDYGYCSARDEAVSARSNCELENNRVIKFEKSLGELIEEEKALKERERK